MISLGPWNFPYEITLNSVNDVTPEGLEESKLWESGDTPLVVSARLDADGKPIFSLTLTL